MNKMTTTSYALLALLARRPWSAYDITQYMKLSPLRRVWPRAESRIYQEPKKLVEYGLAEVREEYSGKRKRTIYCITPAGRKALKQWLGGETSPSEYKYELLVKLLSADHGTRADVQRLLDEAKAHALEEAALIRQGIETVLDEGFKMPEMCEFNTWIVRYMVNDIESRLRWIQQMQTRVGDLAEQSPGANEQLAREEYRLEMARIDELLTSALLA